MHFELAVDDDPEVVLQVIGARVAGGERVAAEEVEGALIAYRQAAS